MKLYRIMYIDLTTGWKGTKELAEAAVKGVAGTHYEVDDVPYTKPELLVWLNTNAVAQDEWDPVLSPQKMCDGSEDFIVPRSADDLASESSARGRENERKVELEEEIANAPYERCKTLMELLMDQLGWHLKRMPKGQD
jgi:hypothetical protein